MSTEEKQSWVASLEQFYFNNRKQINIASIAVIVLVGAFIAYTKYWKPLRENEAQSQLFVAQRYFSQDSLDRALNGDGNYPGMIDIADDYPRTKAGKLANFYAGRIYLEKREFESAKEYLENVSFSDEIMAAMAKGLLADCYMELGEVEKAADIYMDAGKMRENDFSAPINLKKAGMAYELSGDYKNAMKAYEIIEEKYKDSPVGFNVRKYIARCRTKLGE
jgi:predicted negative regulator of RcsB-dependent stress response